MRRTIGRLVSSGYVLFALTLAAQQPTGDPLLVLVGESRAVAVKPNVSSLQAEFIESSEDEGKHYVKGKAATDGAIDIGVGTPVVVVTRKSTPDRLQIIQGKEVPVAISFTDGAGRDVPAPITLRSRDETVARVDGGPTTVHGILTGARAEATTTLDILQSTEPIGSVTVTVLEAVKGIKLGVAEPVPLNEGGPARDARIRLIGQNTGREYEYPQRDLQIKTNDFVDLTPEGWLRAKDLPTAVDANPNPTMTLFSNDGTTTSRAIRASVTLKPGYITFEPATAVLQPDDTQRFKAVLRDRTGSQIPNSMFQWNVPAEYQDYFAVAESNETVEVIWNSLDDTKESKRPSLAKIVATTGGVAGGPRVTATLPIRMGSRPRGFQPLDFQITVLDDTTVRDLYGSRTAQDFIVGHIRFTNDRKDPKSGKHDGASILVFGSSIEVGVSLEKRFTPDGRKSEARRLGKKPAAVANDWIPVDYSTDMRHFVRTLDTAYSVAQPTADPKVVTIHPRDPGCRNVFTYRPHSFEMVVNSIDSRDTRSKRGMTFLALTGLGTLASFATSISPPTAGSVPAVMDKYSNLLLPGMARLFPSLKETHRQNIVAHTMQSIEEIPFGSDKWRVVFFPRQPVRGVLAGHEVRISEICPYFFTVQVAVISKGDKQEISSQ